MKRLVTRAGLIVALLASLLIAGFSPVGEAPIAGATGTGGPYPCPNHGGGSTSPGWFPNTNSSVNCQVDYRNSYWGQIVVDVHHAGSNGICDAPNTNCTRGAIDLWVPESYKPRFWVNQYGTFVINMVKEQDIYTGGQFFGECRGAMGHAPFTNPGYTYNSNEARRWASYSGAAWGGGGLTTTNYPFCNLNGNSQYSGNITGWLNGIYGGNHKGVTVGIDSYTRLCSGTWVGCYYPQFASGHWINLWAYPV